MRWQDKSNGWQLRFAWLPVKVGSEWVWLEPYEARLDEGVLMETREPSA